MHSAAHPSTYGKRTAGLRLFGWTTRLSWIFVFFLTLATEMFPMPLIPWFYFYPYVAFKGVLFLLLGFLTPLSFWRFDSLGLGVLFSVLGAGLVEGLQSVVEGHRASYLEFGVKLLLLFLGFAASLNARYDRTIRVGGFSIRLLDSHLPQQD